MATTNPTTFNIIFLLAEKSVLIKDAGRHCLHQANEHTKVVHHMKSTVEQKVTHNASLSTVFTLLSSIVRYITCCMQSSTCLHL